VKVAGNASGADWKDALKVVLLYALFAGAWILLSDKAVEAMFKDPAQIIRISMIKGWLFVAVTTLLLYVLVLRLVGKIEAAHRQELAAAEDGRRTSRLLDALATSSDDAIFAKDTEGRYVLFNPAAGRYVGKAIDDVLGRDDRAIFPPEQAAAVMANDRRVVAEGGPITIEEALDTASGTRTFLTTKGPLRDEGGAIIGSFGIARDISERKRAELMQEESEERYRRLAEDMPLFIATSLPDGTLTYVNNALTRLVGVPREQLTGRIFFEFLSAEDRLMVKARLASLTPEQPLETHEQTYRSPGQADARHEWTNRAFEEDLRKLSLAVEQSPESIVITNVDARIEYVNDAFVNTTGYSREEVIGKNPRVLHSGNTPAGTYESMWAALSQGQPWKGEFHNKRKDGSEYIEFAIITPLRQPDGTISHYVAIKEDITEKKAPRTRTRQAPAPPGRTGGAAHRRNWSPRASRPRAPTRPRAASWPT
jgi:two-component system sensor histidine kinase/response regulator